MLSYQTAPQKEHGIAIVGIGGAGAGILQCFGSSSADNVRLYTVSLDERVGRATGSNVEFIQLGGVQNHGLGSGGDPELGRRAAEDSRESLSAILDNTRLLVLVAGLGGGTGSGAAPVLAQMAREKGVFLVSVLMMPFSFEGKRRRIQAEKAQEEIARLSDILFCFENDYMENLFNNNRGARAVFEEVDRIMAKATAAVPMLASSPGLINLGLDELATALENNDSRCLFGSGKGYGAHRAEQAARAALESPLVAYRGALRFARTVIVHISGGETMALNEIRIAMETVQAALADEDVTIFFGTTVKPHLGDEIRVTLIASVDSGEFKAALEKEEDEAPLAPVEEEEEVETPVAPVPQVVAPQYDDAEDELEDEEDESETEEEGEDELISTPVSLEDEEEELIYEDEEEDTAVPYREPQLHQGELMPATVPAYRSSDPDDITDRARKLFEDVDNGDSGSKEYTAPVRRRQNTSPEDDDLETPPSLRFNDLRNIFTD